MDKVEWESVSRLMRECADWAEKINTRWGVVMS